MITGRFAAPGKTRTCPHCRATILDSSTVCPGCNHHLRFDSSGASQRPTPAATPLRVEGTLRHPPNGASWEYSVVLAIRNDRGEEIARQVVGVGALQPGDARTFSLAVEVFKPAELKESKPQPADAAQRAPADPRSPDIRAPARPGLPPPPRPATTISDGRPATTRPPVSAAPAPAAAPPSAAVRFPAGAPGRMPSAPLSSGAPSSKPSSTAAATPPTAPSSASPSTAGRTPGQPPLHAPAGPALNGGAAGTGRGAGTVPHPKR